MASRWSRVFFSVGSFVMFSCLLTNLTCFSEEVAFSVDGATSNPRPQITVLSDDGGTFKHLTSNMAAHERYERIDNDIGKDMGDSGIIDQAIDPWVGFVIQANGMSDIEVTEGLAITISYRFFETIETGGDRWLLAETPFGWYSHCCPEHLWFPGIQSEIFNVFNSSEDWITQTVLVLNVLGLPVGTYTFYLGYDRAPNGEIDGDSLVYEKAIVHIKVPITVKLSATPTSGMSPLEVVLSVQIDDPKGIWKSCRLYNGTTYIDCGLYVRQTFSSEGIYNAWAYVTDKYGREVMSNIVTVFVDPYRNLPPTVSNLSVSPSQVSSYDEKFTIHYYYEDPDGRQDVKEHHVGIGTTKLTYPAGGSGQFQRTYNFVEPTTPGTHYIDVYVVDSVGNKSNTLSDSIYFSGGPAPCNTFVEQGGDTPEEHWIEMGQNYGTFYIEYNTYVQEDQIVIWYENTMIWDSGCVGTDGTWSGAASLRQGSSTKVVVDVIPNCRGGSGTKWNFTVTCPSSSPY